MYDILLWNGFIGVVRERDTDRWFGYVFYGEGVLSSSIIPFSTRSISKDRIVLMGTKVLVFNLVCRWSENNIWSSKCGTNWVSMKYPLLEWCHIRIVVQICFKYHSLVSCLFLSTRGYFSPFGVGGGYFLLLIGDSMGILSVIYISYTLNLWEYIDIGWLSVCIFCLWWYKLGVYEVYLL